LKDRDYWFGLYKHTATRYETKTYDWSDDSVGDETTPLYYYNNEYPREYKKREDGDITCVRYTKEHGFEHDDCNTTFYYTCKKAAGSQPVSN